MHAPTETLSTSIGDVPLHEYRLTLESRTWSILHTGAVLTLQDEERYLEQQGARLPYGAMLWPSSIALAHDLAARADALPGARVLELGTGTGLPGVVAATYGACVVQTDRDELALHVCERNAARNGASDVVHRLVDWASFDDDGPYDVVLGADILYATSMHDRLQGIFERVLAPEGRVLLADPFRPGSLPLLLAMERRGWRAALARWSVATQGGAPRAVGVYELSRPT